MILAPRSLHEFATFEGLDLRGQRLDGVEFVDCRFTACLLSLCTLDRCSLEDVTFQGCDLGLVKLADSSLRGARFVECKLSGVDWSQAHPLTFDVFFRDCVLDMGSFADTRLQDLRCEAGRARDVVFANCDLRRAVFDGVDLASASFEGCDLRDADLSSSLNLSLRPDANRLEGTRLPLDAALDHLAQLGIVVPG